MRPRRIFEESEIYIPLLQCFNPAVSEMENPARRRMLARLAFVCKASESQALDVLWAQQSSLLPLLKILSSFQPIREESADIYVSEVISLLPTQWSLILEWSSVPDRGSL